MADIAELLDKGYKVCYISVSLNSYIKSLTIDVTKTDYFDLFRKCVEKGMVYYGFSIKFKDGEPIIYSRLQLYLKECDKL